MAPKSKSKIASLYQFWTNEQQKRPQPPASKSGNQSVEHSVTAALPFLNISRLEFTKKRERPKFTKTLDALAS
ncbi:unnamed protein product [Cylicocyclus nassatus]|uniref:Uncharacterized protein n=1 Tax=Cylicocyclus nassatus TaxID=53992 RepID=A0AA36M2T0_CYLNA|nr:unnamed protein product [Cylicocyclus nassatus]